MIVIKDPVDNFRVLRSIIKIILRVERLLCECRHCRGLRIVGACNRVESYTLSSVLPCAGQKEGQETAREVCLWRGRESVGDPLQGRQSAGPSADRLKHLWR